jgi:hypothetical protein
MLIQVPQLASTLTFHALSTNTFESLTPVFLAMASMTTEPTDYGVVGAESDAVGQLMSLLNEFLENSLNQLAAIREEENTRVADYNTLTGILTETIEKIKTELVDVNDHLREMERCINTEDSVFTTAQAKFARNQEIFTSTETMCALFDDEFNAAEEARRNELILLGSLKTMVVSKLQHDRGMQQSALEQEDGFVSYDGARNYEYESDQFAGSEYDSTSETYRGNIDA